MTKFPILDFRFAILRSRIESRRSKVLCLLCLVSCVLLWIGCGERENRHLVNARTLIRQGKYKEGQEIAELRNELQLALEEEPGNPEALCPLKALEIIAANASTATRQEAIAEIVSLVRSVEDEIKDLEAIDEDLLTDDDRDRLKELSRKWNLSMEPTVVILKSQTGWITPGSTGGVGRPAIDLLIEESLKVSNPMIQRDIVELLVSLQSQSFEALIEALKNDSSLVRRQAVVTLARISDERAVEPIASLLDDEDPAVRFYVPVALDMISREKREGIGTRHAVSLDAEPIVNSLHKALKNEMAQVRMAAADILGKMEDETAIDLLVELLADDNSHVQTSATNALEKIGKPVVPKLIEVLESKAENISLPPTDFVGDKIGDRYKKVLAKRAALQVSAASILGNTNDPRAIEPLLEAMKREASAEATEEEKTNAESVRSGAADALEAMGPAAVEPLIRVLESSESENARVNAASILGDIGDKRAVVPLINALKDGSKNVRAAAAESLGTLKDRRATLPLMEALKDSDPVTRVNAATALGTIADKTATQALINVVMDKTEREQVRTAAITSLGVSNNEPAQETLVKVLIDEYEKDGTRKTAAAALRKIEKPWASEALIALLRGEIVSGVVVPEEGLIKDWTPLVEISTGGEKEEVKAPASGKLIEIYVQEGEAAEANALIGLVSFMDKEIKEEERSSIRAAAALALGLVKGDGALPALTHSVRKDKSAAVRKNAVQALWEQDKAEGRATLIRTLRRDDSGVVRSEAAKGLGKGNLKGADGVPPLMRALRKDKYESTRVQAAWAHSEIQDKRAVEPLIDAIVEGRKGEPEADAVIAKVTTALDNIAGPSVDPLVEVLQNTDIDEVPRSKAAHILGLIEDTKATEPLIAALEDESVVVRSEAGKSLGLITDRRAVPALMDVLADEDEWVTARANAAEALGKIKDERAVMPLIDVLGSEIAAIRGNAVVALGPIEDKRAAMPLVQILEDGKEDDTIRADAASSLGSIADTRAVGPLIVALNSDVDDIRQSAATALGELEANAAAEPLMAIVSNVNEPVALRTYAAEALGEIGDKRANTLLRERLGEYNESDIVWNGKPYTVWNKVAEAAGKLRVEQLPARVSERANDTWETAEVRSAALMALASSERDISILLEMLDNDTKEIRCGAALALGESGRKEAVQPLIDKLLNDAEEVVRRDSAKALAALADPDSEQALITALKEDATESVKVESAIALGNIKGENGIAELMNTLQDTSVAKKIRWNAATALGATGSREAIPALEAALDDNIGNIHFEAAEALRKITGESSGYER